MNQPTDSIPVFNPKMSRRGLCRNRASVGARAPRLPARRKAESGESGGIRVIPGDSLPGQRHDPAIADAGRPPLSRNSIIHNQRDVAAEWPMGTAVGSIVTNGESTPIAGRFK